MEKEANKISIKTFAHLFGESEKCNRRFCFILGSGASREPGIMTGVEMVRNWADELKKKYEERPMVVGHEALTEFINLNINRPIIAKIHRSLYFHPSKWQNETKGLVERWQETIKNALMVYTPIVIGYAGGPSLMDSLKKEDTKMNGLYWCYWNQENPRMRSLI